MGSAHKWKNEEDREEKGISNVSPSEQRGLTRLTQASNGVINNEGHLKGKLGREGKEKKKKSEQKQTNTVGPSHGFACFLSLSSKEQRGGGVATTAENNRLQGRGAPRGNTLKKKKKKKKTPPLKNIKPMSTQACWGRHM
jgi:hypothetical protein